MTLQSSHRGNQQPIGASSNELTMQAVQSANCNFEQYNQGEPMDAIESFKKRNIQKNARGGQVEEE